MRHSGRYRVRPMPTSKQARSAQNRQKDRLAVAAIEKHRIRRRRRIITGIVGAVLVVGMVIAALMLPNDDNKVEVSSPPNANGATTIPAKPCVKMQGALPKGAPKVPITEGVPPTKLVTKDLVTGKGAVVKAGDQLTVDYIGVACSTGKVFDSSYSRGKPSEFALSGVIPGWQQGLPGMKVGGRRLLEVPPDLAYGANGQAPIGPNETLWFVVDVKKAGPPPVTTTTAG
jgi:peptidylprolyl isomerase